MLDQFRAGLGDAWASIATFVPKLIGFLLILLIGYFIAKAVSKILDKVLERVGFDKAVERGGVGKALEKSKYDASSILGKMVFYALFLFVLQLAFGVFGPNPISELIAGVIAYLPNVFVAILIVVIGAAVAAAVKEVIEAALGGLSYGKALALVASAMVLSIAVFAALDQLNVAENIVTGLFYAALAIIVGSSIIAIGGGGIKTMSKYWERASQKADQESSTIKQEAGGSKERVRERAQERADQARPEGSGRTGAVEPRSRTSSEYPPEVREERARRTSADPDASYIRDPDDRIVP
jgi:hypothetical protein